LGTHSIQRKHTSHLSHAIEHWATYSSHQTIELYQFSDAPRFLYSIHDSYLLLQSSTTSKEYFVRGTSYLKNLEGKIFDGGVAWAESLFVCFLWYLGLNSGPLP
jgi:hypothetical protein